MNEHSANPIMIDVEGVSRTLRIRPHIYIKLVKNFSNSLTGKVRLLGEALAVNDRDQMRIILHEIKGTSGNLRLLNIIGPETVLHTAVKASANAKILTAHLAVLSDEAEKLQQHVNTLPDDSGGSYAANSDR